MSVFDAAWLALREDADAAARSEELPRSLSTSLAEPSTSLATGPEIVVRDLGCGTGSLGRWLAARLPGPQRWILHDRDPALLARAAASMPNTAADGSPVTAETHQGDLTELRATDLRASSLVAASALLDLLTAGEVEGLVAACVEAGCPALLTLSVTGAVRMRPAESLDTDIATAFNEHQRRTTRRGRLLGPDAVETARRAFTRRGASVRIAASPWHLGPEHADLTAEWLRGWVGAACEQRPELAAEASTYLERRRELCRAGQLNVEVGHCDLLAVPGGAR